MSASSSLPGGLRAPTDSSASPTVLVVEDEEAVRSLVQLVLQGQGFHLLLAHDGQQALEVSRRYAGRIDLLLSDWYLPDTGGQDLARRLLASRRETKVLFMSGSDKTLSGQDPAGFLRKPFTTTELVDKVHAALQQERKLAP